MLGELVGEPDHQVVLCWRIPGIEFQLALGVHLFPVIVRDKVRIGIRGVLDLDTQEVIYSGRKRVLSLVCHRYEGSVARRQRSDLRQSRVDGVDQQVPRIIRGDRRVAVRSCTRRAWRDECKRLGRQVPVADPGALPGIVPA